MSDRSIALALARLEGLQMSLIPLMTLHGDVADQYNAILQTVKDVPEIPFDALVAGHRDVYSGGSGARFCHRDMFFGKMGQAINLLRAIQSSDRVAEVIGVYDSIVDTDLKSRCQDLLRLQGNFDRPIAQATQVLEDRLRQKSGDNSRRVGVALLHAVANPEPADSAFSFANDQSEHQGVFRLIEGMFLAFRNPTHHFISDRFTREKALQVCAFVDTLLSIIGEAAVRKELIKKSRV